MSFVLWGHPVQEPLRAGDGRFVPPTSTSSFELSLRPAVTCAGCIMVRATVTARSSPRAPSALEPALVDLQAEIRALRDKVAELKRG